MFCVEAEAETQLAAMADYLADLRIGQYETSSVLCVGWADLTIERKPGRSFPHRVPHYE